MASQYIIFNREHMERMVQAQQKILKNVGGLIFI